ncbi:uncharacterized protein DNG_03259 [Cephalotrichum gorgonifer]|uniref:Uncharacterized protein n=1 Tax=Cephalotrichum gorgonifer TaxID=2041049 RepID=A0AAE8MVX1_9PEZI|nr:uncharacterized protein DNG_03259 [Cephalotrichum gorgonifer]
MASTNTPLSVVFDAEVDGCHP